MKAVEQYSISEKQSHITKPRLKFLISFINICIKIITKQEIILRLETISFAVTNDNV